MKHKKENKLTLERKYLLELKPRRGDIILTLPAYYVLIKP